MYFSLNINNPKGQEREIMIQKSNWKNSNHINLIFYLSACSRANPTVIEPIWLTQGDSFHLEAYFQCRAWSTGAVSTHYSCLPNVSWWPAGPAMKKLLLVHTSIIVHVIPWENGHWFLAARERRRRRILWLKIFSVSNPLLAKPQTSWMATETSHHVSTATKLQHGAARVSSQHKPHTSLTGSAQVKNAAWAELKMCAQSWGWGAGPVPPNRGFATQHLLQIGTTDPTSALLSKGSSQPMVITELLVQEKTRSSLNHDLSSVNHSPLLNTERHRQCTYSQSFGLSLGIGGFTRNQGKCCTRNCDSRNQPPTLGRSEQWPDCLDAG